MTDKQALHNRLANLALGRIDPNHGSNPEIEKENEKLLKVAHWHIRMAGGDVGESAEKPRGK